MDLHVLIKEAILVKNYSLETTQKMLEDRYSVEEVHAAWSDVQKEQFA